MLVTSCLLYGAAGLFCYEPPPPPPPPPPLPIVTTTTTTRPVVVTTTTTTVVEPLTGLEYAQSLIGKTRVELGFTEWWCAEFVRYIYNRPEWPDSPSWLKSQVTVVPEPTAGDLVFVSYQPENGETHHVGIVESVNADGSVNTIEGNGFSSEIVMRGIRQPFEITGFGVIQER